MDKIKLKGVVAEDFCNYKLPSMFLITCHCNWKCCIEQGLDVSICQNEPIARQPIKEFDIDNLFKFYMNNDISKAIVIGGLEPFLQSEEIYSMISYFRNNGCTDTFVIYTGYTEKEVNENKEWNKILELGNIIIKYGRFVPNQSRHRDELLGIELASDNQYSVKYD